MKFYYAPMEGVTGYLYRNAHKASFDHIDKYFAPFIVADQTDSFKSKDRNDILPEHNESVVLIPQILTNNAMDFIHTSRKIQWFGYTEINLNLGCPSGTVVSKNRGSGFLALRDELNQFLETIFSAPETDISIKTRLGKENPDEFYALIEIFNQYPLKELIIHPRIQRDMYKNYPNLKVFRDALAVSKNPVCYNGDIFTVKDYLEFTAAFPEVETLMIGRGLLTNPGLVEQIKTSKTLDKARLRAFHDEIYEGYKGILFGDKNVLFKMKETWYYLIQAFTEHEKYAKMIRKSETLGAYELAVHRVFSEQDIRSEFGYSR